ncbi:MAG: GAF domain-containing sensor histidine kinase [Deltaproteobacteria bacterium]|nr:GAF domain-containing sensor histidine kinase [Deltaproteobacteria bacterium]
MRVDPKTARTISRIAGVIAAAVAIILPLGYLVLSYQNQAGALEAEAEINGRIATQVINANSEMWRFQQSKLEEFLSRRPRHGHAESRRILDTQNKVIAESVDPLRPPLLTRSLELRDSGIVVGRIEINRSLQPLLLRTGLVALLGLLFGLGVFVVLRILPLRALDTAMADNVRLLEEGRRRFLEMQTLRETGAAISSTLDLHTVLDFLMEKIDLFLPYTAALVWLFNRETGQVERATCWNLDQREWKERKLTGTPSLIQAAIEGKTPVVARNVQTDPRTLDPAFYRNHGLISYLGVPLLVKGEVLGVLVCLTREEHEFGSEEVQFLSTLAGQAAIAIYNSQLYEQTKKQAVELEKANTMQADFSAMIAHDLRSPLTATISAAAMVGDGLFGAVNEEQKKWLAKIEANTQKLVDLVNDFLDLSKLEAGCIDLVMEQVDLEQLIQNSLDDCQVLAHDKNVSLESGVDSGLPRIKADPHRLGQVFANLLSNAIKFTGERGKIEVGAAQSNGAEVRVWVRDNGAGMSPQEISALFQKYRQTRSGKDSKHKGTGLGLVICKMIVEAHGGKIWAESEEAKGTTVTFTLPYEG